MSAMRFVVAGLGMCLGIAAGSLRADMWECDEPGGGTPEDFGNIIESETAKWKKFVQDNGIKAEE